MAVNDLVQEMIKAQTASNNDDISIAMREVLDTYFYANQKRDKDMLEKTSVMIGELDNLIELSTELSFKEKVKYKEIIQDTIDSNNTTKRIIDKSTKGSMTLLKSLLPTTDFLIGSIVQQSPLLAMGLNATKNVIEGVKQMRGDRELEHRQRMQELDVDAKIQKEYDTADFGESTKAFESFNTTISEQSDILGNHTGLLEKINTGIENQSSITEKQFQALKRERTLEGMSEGEKERESDIGTDFVTPVLEKKKESFIGRLFGSVSGLMGLVSGGFMAGITAIGTAITGVIATMAPIVAGIIAVGGLAYRFYQGWNKAKEKFGETVTLTDKIASGLGEVVGLAGDMVDTIVNFVGGFFGLPEIDLGGLMNSFYSNMYKRVFDFIKNPGMIVEPIISIYDTVVNTITNFISDFKLPEIDIPGLMSEFYDNMYKRVFDFIKNPGMIVEPIKDIFDVMVDSFYRIKNNLIENIAGMAERLPFGGKKLAKTIRTYKSELPKKTKQESVKQVSPKVKKFGVEQSGQTPPQTEQDGIASDTRKLSDLFKFNSGVSEKDLAGLDPAFLSNLKGMAAEYKDTYGEKISLNSAYRSFDDQKRLKEKYGSRAAAPGSSMHNYGLAVDMNTNNANKAIKAGLFDKYGFNRPVSGETWHVEPSGINRKKIVADGMKSKSSSGSSGSSGIKAEKETKLASIQSESTRTKLNGEIESKTQEINHAETSQNGSVVMDNRTNTNNVNNNIIAQPTNFNTIQPDYEVLFGNVKYAV